VVRVNVLQKTSSLAQRGMGRPVDQLMFSQTTGEDGRFEVRGMRGVRLSVQSYAGDHYVVGDPRCTGWTFDYNAAYSRSLREGGSVHEPDRKRPAVFVVDRGR
jgi:hypothetical protein